MAESESQAEVANPHSAETEYWPKVKNSPHLAPKPKPKFGRPLISAIDFGTEVTSSSLKSISFHPFPYFAIKNPHYRPTGPENPHKHK